MAPYDEWNKLDDDDEDELQESSVIPCLLNLHRRLTHLS